MRLPACRSACGGAQIVRPARTSTAWTGLVVVVAVAVAVADIMIIIHIDCQNPQLISLAIVRLGVATPNELHCFQVACRACQSQLGLMAMGRNQQLHTGAPACRRAPVRVLGLAAFTCLLTLEHSDVGQAAQSCLPSLTCRECVIILN